MKLKIVYLIIFTSFLLSTCSVNSKEVKMDLAGKTYVFSLVSSKEECDQLHSKGIFNCARYIEFNSKNKVDVIFSDISIDGVYNIKNKEISISLLEPEDGYPAELVFIANDKFTELTLISDGSNDIWKLSIEGVKPWDL